MRQNFYALFSIFLFSAICAAQTLHVIETRADNIFFPSNITVEVQDTVRWINSSSGLHNVVADDGSYTSGAASNSQWVFDHIFTTTGDSRYYCSVHGGAGGVGMSGIVHVTNVSKIPDNNYEVRIFELHQNYPNPFNPSTNIQYNLPQGDFVTLTIYNSTGQKVRTLVNSLQSRGNYTITWDSRNDNGKVVSSGVYYYILNAGDNKVLTRKMILQR
jgi:plastocyanin